MGRRFEHVPDRKSLTSFERFVYALLFVSVGIYLSVTLAIFYQALKQ